MIFDLATVIAGTGAEVLHAGPDGRVISGNLLNGDLARPLGRVRVDSREVAEDDLFVALPGDRVDGHAFIEHAFRQDARACLVAATRDRAMLEAALRRATTSDDPRERRYLLLVHDPLAALQRLAGHWRGLSTATIIGVTGSLGKTTTKDVLASLLAPQKRVLKSEGNLNTEIGLPLMLLRLRSRHQVAVLEMGMYALGEIATLTRIAVPRIGIVTNVAPVHLERLGSIERIARAKSELVAGLPVEGLAILNGDNRWTRAMARYSGICRSTLIGFASDCAYRAADVTTNGLEGFRFTLYAEGRTHPVVVSLPGAHLVHAALAAIAAARELGTPWDTILQGLEAFRIEGRQVIRRRTDGLVIIDDSYNAAPESVLAALEVLRAAPGERIAILGDMLELGPEEERAHRRVGERVATVADALIVQGPRAAWIADGAIAAGLPPERITRAMSNHEAVTAARALLQVPVAAGFVPAPASRAVLIKGSRGMGMEEIARSLEERS